MTDATNVCTDCNPAEAQPTDTHSAVPQTNSQVIPKSPRISIEYCTQCRWMLRATWLMQELLTTFGDKIGEIALIPGASAVFQIKVNDELIWDRKRDGGFPEIKEAKQLIRDRIAPEMSLGHSDTPAKK
eukprot:Phypoly_transcript_15904.p1 GENE.Phypoly_transcript_15904~~Phypoly_transcript_15904.p1  ORF type:complete len:129 (+),score=28.10 Phypoly_transcript_15904:26-412(+)